MSRIRLAKNDVNRETNLLIEAFINFKPATGDTALAAS